MNTFQGDVQYQHGLTLEQALYSFKRKFREKSGNAFEKRDQFVTKKNKYDLVKVSALGVVMLIFTSSFIQIDHSRATETKDENEEGAEHLPCTLDPRVKDVVELICDFGAMERQLEKFNFDAKRNPLGEFTCSCREKRVC